jgi:hypothetical protein
MAIIIHKARLGLTAGNFPDSPGFLKNINRVKKGRKNA